MTLSVEFSAPPTLEILKKLISSIDSIFDENLGQKI